MRWIGRGSRCADSGAPPVVRLAAPGERVSVHRQGETHTIESDDCTVSVGGDTNTATVTGHTTALTASGVHNEITVESADLIAAAGIGIRVTYRSGEPNSNCPGSATSCRWGEGRTAGLRVVSHAANGTPGL